MDAKLKFLLLLAPLALGGCLDFPTDKKPVATAVADPREARPPEKASNQALSPEVLPPAHQRAVQLSWSTESAHPNVTITVSADACEEPPRYSAPGTLHHERVSMRAQANLSVCLLTSAEPQWSMVEDEPGGWHSLAGWAVSTESATKVARLLFTGPEGHRQSVVASASLFCSGARRCMSVFSAHQGGGDTPASVPLTFVGKGLTQLWWGPDAPALAAPAEELDLDAVQDLSKEDPAAADAESAAQDAAAAESISY